MKYKIVFSYDGSAFLGYAKQPNLKTIQGELEKNLSLILNENIILSASGRTDKGVHALNQVASFSTIRKINDKDKFLHSINKLLNEEIYVKKIVKVRNDFDARFSARKKEYHYLINLGEFEPTLRKYQLTISDKNFDINKFIEGSNLFLGKHNFINFCSKDEDKDGFIRTIYDFKVIKKRQKLLIKISGDGFMRYEVRKIIGTLIYYSLNKITFDKIKYYLNETKKRDIVPFTASPIGLYLFKVYY